MLNSGIGLVFMLLLRGGGPFVKGNALLTVLAAVPGMAALLQYLGTAVNLAMCMMLSMTYYYGALGLSGRKLALDRSIHSRGGDEF